ncbi:hypothetical protein C9F11_45350 (plasmid) [Streptomyces sp. YIM 121038]|uniref:DUF6233 domain-containing protein n=1 Tax=Streptomyces sp. YIM 121038 TaxID=2136401 RepID=UPI001110898A|nr:DUF6233 domain-containing protein [Streptomyces sp. YIM 121038]QCX82630.1 hypothetical protein C9F11_45350 [Streptomyces sp. YIM 121038]
MRPLDGTDYSAVATERVHPPQPPPGWAWKVERQAVRGRMTGLVVHGYDCPSSPDGDEELNLGQALTALYRPGARACTQCEAAVALSYWITDRDAPDAEWS